METSRLRNAFNMAKERLKTMDRKKLYFGSFALAAAVIASVVMIFHRNNGYADGEQQGAQPVTAKVMQVETRVVDNVVAATGTLTSKNVSVLSSKIMGRVVFLGVHEGDYVGEGKVLMRIESGEIGAQAYQAQAAYNNAKNQYDRIKKLFDEQASTQMEMDQATLGLESAEAGMKAARSMESYMVITAPISGQIVEKRINLGEMAMPGQPVLKIEDNKNLRLEVTVNEQDILSIRPGMTVRVEIDAIPGKELKGTVAQIVPASDVRTHSFMVKIDIPARSGLITGMFGKAYFSSGAHQAVVVPRSAVLELSGIAGVYLLSADDTALFQMVQLGREHGAGVEVLTGLKPGDRIVADRQAERINGRKVIAAAN